MSLVWFWFYSGVCTDINLKMDNYSSKTFPKRMTLASAFCNLTGQTCGLFIFFTDTEEQFQQAWAKRSQRLSWKGEMPQSPGTRGRDCGAAVSCPAHVFVLCSCASASPQSRLPASSYGGKWGCCSPEEWHLGLYTGTILTPSLLSG